MVTLNPPQVKALAAIAAGRNVDYLYIEPHPSYAGSVLVTKWEGVRHTKIAVNEQGARKIEYVG